MKGETAEKRALQENVAEWACVFTLERINNQHFITVTLKRLKYNFSKMSSFSCRERQFISRDIVIIILLLIME